MQIIRRNKWKIHAAPGAPIEPFICPPESLPNYQKLASSKKTLVFRFTHGNQNYYVKTYTHRSLDRKLKDIFRGIWIRNAVRIHDKMKAFGFRVPEILCYGRKGMQGTIVYEELKGKSIVEWQKELAVDILDDIFDAFGHCVGKFHCKGFFHGDLHIGNIYLDNPDQANFIFLDNDKTKHLPMLPWILRRKDLSRMLYSLQYYRSDSEQLWNSFYRSYCSENVLHVKSFGRWERSVTNKVEKMKSMRQ